MTSKMIEILFVMRIEKVLSVIIVKCCLYFW